MRIDTASLAGKFKIETA